MNSAVIRIEVLTRENYDTWKLQMQALLTKNDAWMYVSGELPKPEVIEGDVTSLTALENWKRGLFRGMNLPEISNDMPCEICLKGKMTALPTIKKSERKSDLLEIIHTDVCGPMRCESLGKLKYFVTFIDDATRWCEVRFLKSKDEVFEAFKEVKALFENQKGKKIKFLQSDNGTEYVNGRFDIFLKESGIARRLTVPYHSQQNGVSERKNRTLMNIARCLLIQSNLSDYMWAEAVHTANYLRNRCPTSSLNGRTPYEAWHDIKPEVSHLKEFGCKVFCLDSRLTKGKLSPRSKEAQFVGYSDTSKGYRVWFPKERFIQVVRDLKFVENCPILENFRILQNKIIRSSRFRRSN